MTINEVRKLLHVTTLELSRSCGKDYAYVRRLCQQPLASRPDMLEPLLRLATRRVEEIARAVAVLGTEWLHLDRQPRNG